jgi:polyferredoxin
VATLVISGFWLNTQYSFAQIVSLLGGKFPPLDFSIAFLLVVILPLFLILVGNLYCGYLCPFGALQELIGDLRPESLKSSPSPRAWRYARTAKYVTLFILVLLFVRNLNPAVASSDFLVTIFRGGDQGKALMWAIACLALAFFFPRFWCRTLCPAGAFLSLLNGVRGPKRIAPKRKIKLCPYGVTAASELDCICCDRCRSPAPPDVRRAPARSHVPARRFVDAAFLILVGVAGLLWIQTAVSTREPVPRSAVSRPRATGAAGEPRDVDMTRLREMIEQGRLSDREALYYEKVEK